MKSTSNSKLILICSLLFLVTSCGQARFAQEKVNDLLNTGITKFDSASLAADYIRNFKVSCADANCAAVGVLLWRDGLTVGQCTASLIDQDVVMTNSHCVPDDLKEFGKKWAGEMHFTLMQIGMIPQHVLDLDYVMSVIPSGPMPVEVGDTDIAFLKMTNKSTRKPLQIDTSGISDHQKITVYKVTHQESDDSYTLASVHCEAIQNSMINFNAVANVGHLFLNYGCGVIPGNSGSPTLNTAGKAIGVVSFNMDDSSPHDGIEPHFFAPIQTVQKVTTPAAPSPADVAKNNDQFIKSLLKYAPKLDVKKIVSQFGGGTNLACVAYPGRTAPLDPVCAIPLRGQASEDDNLTNFVNSNFKKNYEDQINMTANKWVRTQPPIFWKVDAKAADLQFTDGLGVSLVYMKASCYVHQNGDAGKKNFSLHPPYWFMKLTLNQWLQPVVSIVSGINTTPINYSLDPCLLTSP